jgi:HPt (histidine-containing phosphotransfer) domain-containing protein
MNNNLNADFMLEADIEFRKKLQAFFLKSNQNKMDEILKTLETGDIEYAYRMTHTLKSNAAQLGKVNLQKAAADVERQLKGGTNLTTEEQLKTLESEINIVLEEFKSLAVDIE